MRLEAGKAGIWRVYHAGRYEALHRVAWIDDKTHQWYQYGEPLRITRESDGTCPRVVGETHQARKIKILPDLRLVIIDPRG